MPSSTVALSPAKEWLVSQTGSSAESEIGRKFDKFFGRHLAEPRRNSLAPSDLASEMLLFYTDLRNSLFQAGQTLQSSVLTYQIEKALFWLTSRSISRSPMKFATICFAIRT